MTTTNHQRECVTPSRRQAAAERRRLLRTGRNDDMANQALARNDGRHGPTAYADRIMAIPMLTHEEELRLTRLWRDERDAAARQRVMEAHLRLAVKIARGFAGYGIDMEDMMDEGAAGLSRAMDKFDPEKGFRFVTYATWWIRASIMDHILRTSYQTPMGTTAASKKLFFNLRRLKAKLGIDAEHLAPEHLTALARATGTSEDEVAEMHLRMRSDLSVDMPDAVTGRTMLDGMVDGGPLADEILSARQEEEIRTALLRQALDVLNPRERHVVEARRLHDEPLTLESLSQVYGVTRERIRQIEVKALDRLQKRVIELARHRRYLPIAA